MSHILSCPNAVSALLNEIFHHYESKYMLRWLSSDKNDLSNEMMHKNLSAIITGI